MRVLMAVSPGLALSTSQTSNPIGKVLQLLDNLSAKVTRDGEEESVQYAKYVQWCEDTAKNNQWQLKNGAERTAALKAQIEKYGADIETTGSRIEDLVEAITKNEDDLEQAAGVRKHEHQDFVESDRELVESIDSLERAISILRKNGQKGFLQTNSAAVQQVADTFTVLLDASIFTVEDKAPLMGLVQAKADAEEDDGFTAAEQAVMGQAPEAAAYEKHDGTKVVEGILNDLMDKAVARRNAGQKGEMNAQHSFEMLKQSLSDEIKSDNKDMKSAKKKIASLQEAKSDAEGDLALTEKGYTSDSDGFKKLQQDCMQKASDHEVSVRERQAELAALEKAKEVIQSATGGAAGKAYSFSQVQQKGVDLSHVISKLRSVGRDANDMKVSFLASEVATTAASMEDPFGKVKGMISNMIERLLQQAKAEASHKEYCDKEMGETTMKQDDHQDSLDSLSAKINKAASRVEALKAEISDIDSELATLAKSEAESSQMRQSEHSDYLQTKTDYEQGIDGVQAAIKVLREYYSSGGALVQQPTVSTHSASSGSASGIIGLLEVAESDFSKMLAEVEADEKEAQNVYEHQRKEDRMTKATRTTDRKYKVKEQRQLESSLAELRQDKEGEEGELQAVDEYMSKLRKMCVAKPDSYEERKAKRAQEIAGLKEALTILGGETVSLVAVSDHITK